MAKLIKLWAADTDLKTKGYKMASIRWPASLPQMLRLEGLNAQRKSSVIRTQMDAGPVKVRQRYTVTTKEFTGTVLLTETQRKTLEEWYQNTLGSGVLRFEMIDPQTLQFAEFRFIEDYQETSVDGYWEISMTLEKLNV